MITPNDHYESWNWVGRADSCLAVFHRRHDDTADRPEAETMTSSTIVTTGASFAQTVPVAEA